MKILCTGDLHIGRRSSKVLDEQESRRQSPAAVWDAIVAWAIEHDVDLVALTGDVVDRENRYFEALGPLERGLLRLTAAGIDVVAVSGNHDFDVLPRLVDVLPSERFHLLGRGGTWEERTISRGARQLRVQGWSFPTEHHAESPLTGYASLGASSSTKVSPAIVLLHADLDTPTSRYAPVMRRELAALPVAACLLGHVHRPLYEPSDHGPALLYPGSPQALDPGEMGVHGPWLLELEGSRFHRATQIPLSRMRYEELTVDVAGVTELADVQTLLGTAVREMLAETATNAGALELLSLRLKLVGRTALHHCLPRELAGQLEEFAPTRDKVRAQVEKLSFETRPAVDYHELARGADAPGMLARLILDLEENQGNAELERLASAASRRLSDLHYAAAFEPVSSDAPPDLATTRDMLHEAATSLLDELLAQKESA